MSKKSMETTTVKEVEGIETPKWLKLPLICKETNGANPKYPVEVMVMASTSSKTYKKAYGYREKNIRRIKEVKLPVSHNGRKFDSVEKLWPYLLENCGYKIVD